MAAITSAASGDSNVASTWTGGVVPVVGDKVTIQHPGTNSLASGVQYATSSALAIGATAIPLVTGTGTIVAGECIQLLINIGTDEDGQPIYDGTYYRVTTGITAAGQTLVIAAPGLTFAAPSGTSVVNVGHAVRLVGTHNWGDDTSSPTATSNGVINSGVLYWDTTANATLTARGSVYLNAQGKIEIGSPAVPMPSSVIGTLVLNDSGTLGAGKHALITNNNSLAPQFIMRGAVRTRNTALTAAAGAGATSIQVAASVGWAIGDRLVIATDTTDPARAQVVTITGGAAPNWSVTAITNARAIGCEVGNLSSNVVVKSASAANPGFITVNADGGTKVARLNMQDVRLEDLGPAGGWSGIVNIQLYNGALNIYAASVPAAGVVVRRVAIEATTTAATTGLSIWAPWLERGVFKDLSIRMQPSSGRGIAFGAGASVDIDAVVYSASNAVLGASGDASAGCALTGKYFGSTDVYNAQPGFKTTFNGCKLVSNSVLLSHSNGASFFQGCSINVANRLFTSPALAASAVNTFDNCTFLGAALTGNLTQSNAPSQTGANVLRTVNGSTADNRVMSYWQTTVTDATTRWRSTYSVRLLPKVANTAIAYTFTLPATAGVAQTIVGALRFDSTYGTATPPKFTLSGQGVSQSFTCAATADAWSPFALTVTPTSTGDITATVTIQSASTAGFAWLDGVWHYPMTQSVRHWGYQWLPQAAQLVDSRITLTEAAALALPVTVNHGASTITVTGPLTNAQVLQACLADLVQTANQSQAVHITSANGAEFVTSYAVVLSGSGATTGAYTDASGRHVLIAAPALVSGTRVQVYDVTGATELFNGVLSGTGLSLPVTWSTDRTIRLRADHATKLPLQTLGVLSSSGLQFLDVQADDTVYASNGIDGSTVTEFAPDGANIQIDINDPDGVTQVQRLYAWMQHYQTTSAGIASVFFGALSAIDSTRYVINQALANILLDNVGATPVRMIGGTLERADGSTVIAASSNSIQIGTVIKVVSAPVITVPTGERLVTMQASGAVVARG